MAKPSEVVTAFDEFDVDDEDDDDDCVTAKDGVAEEVVSTPPTAVIIHAGAAPSRSVQPKASRARSAERCRSRVNRS